MVRKLIQALVVLFILLGSVPTGKAQAQTQFSNCVDGKCTFPITRWSADCTFNIKQVFNMLGDGQNSWLIPVGGQRVSYNAKAGSLTTDSGYKNIPYDDNGNGIIDSAGDGLGEDMPGRCACDVATMLYVTALANGLQGYPTEVNHSYSVPPITDKQYLVTIWNPGKDIEFVNPFAENAYFQWSFTDKDVTIWVNKGNQPALVPPQLPELLATAAPEAQSDLVIVDETEFLKTACPKMETQTVVTNYPKKIVVHHTDTAAITDFFAASIKNETTDHCWWDAPPYNAVITPDGVVHVLTAWGAKSNNAGCEDSSSPDGCNNTNYYAISMVGDFQVRQSEVPEAQLKALIGYVAKLIRDGYFDSADVTLVGHRDISPDTSCPGDVLYTQLPDVLAKAKEQATAPSGTQPNVSRPFGDLSSIRWEIVGIVLLVVLLLFRRRRVKATTLVVVSEIQDPKKYSPKKDIFGNFWIGSIIYGVIVWLLVPASVKEPLSTLMFHVAWGLDASVYGTFLLFFAIWWRKHQGQQDYYGVREIGPGGETRIAVYQRSQKKSASRRLFVVILSAVLVAIGLLWFMGGRPQLTPFMTELYQLGQVGEGIKGAVGILNQWGWAVDSTWVDNLTKAPDQLAQGIQSLDIVMSGLMVIAVVMLVWEFIGIRQMLMTLVIASLMLGSFNGATRVDWKVKWDQWTGKSDTSTVKTPPTVNGSLPQGDGTLYAGVYGALNGWGTLGRASNATEAIAAADEYAGEIRQWYSAGSVVPVVNVRYADNDTAIDQIIAGCAGKCVLLLDVTPNQDVNGLIERFAGSGDHVWFDIDLEHRGVKTSASEFNSWAEKYFSIRKEKGYSTLGIFALYDFRGDPWLTPPSEVVWTYNDGQGLVIPIFDGHCSGSPCAETKYNSTRATLGNYPGAPAVGIMEFLRRWGCGSVYGDCGFTAQEYWQEFKPLLLMSQ
jgi:hypothetical protein